MADGESRGFHLDATVSPASFPGGLAINSSVADIFVDKIPLTATGKLHLWTPNGIDLDAQDPIDGRRFLVYNDAHLTTEGWWRVKDSLGILLTEFYVNTLSEGETPLTDSYSVNIAGGSLVSFLKDYLGDIVAEETRTIGELQAYFPPNPDQVTCGEVPDFDWDIAGTSAVGRVRVSANDNGKEVGDGSIRYLEVLDTGILPTLAGADALLDNTPGSGPVNLVALMPLIAGHDYKATFTVTTYSLNQGQPGAHCSALQEVVFHVV